MGVATEVVVRDVRSAMLVEALHALVFDTTRRIGWPSAKDLCMAPYSPWEGSTLVIHRPRPTG